MNDLNAYIEGIYEPVTDERTDAELKVVGEIPRDLSGAYVQNNPNPQYKPQGLYHWFDGDGMVHGVQLFKGKAIYRNRYIHTAAFQQEREAGRPLWDGILNPFEPALERPDKDTANTDLIMHNGKLLALWWLSGQPYALDPVTLETLGPENFKGSLKSAEKLQKRLTNTESQATGQTAATKGLTSNVNSASANKYYESSIGSGLI